MRREKSETRLVVIPDVDAETVKRSRLRPFDDAVEQQRGDSQSSICAIDHQIVHARALAGSKHRRMRIGGYTNRCQTDNIGVDLGNKNFGDVVIDKACDTLTLLNRIIEWLEYIGPNPHMMIVEFAKQSRDPGVIVHGGSANRGFGWHWWLAVQHSTYLQALVRPSP